MAATPTPQYNNWNNNYGEHGGGGLGDRGRQGGRGGGGGYGYAADWLAQGQGGSSRRGSGCGCGRNSGRGGGNSKWNMNPFKRYDNSNYYWSCGYDVENWHNSKTFPPHRRYSGHQETETKNNTMGGTTKGKHKEILLSNSSHPRHAN